MHRSGLAREEWYLDKGEYLDRIVSGSGGPPERVQMKACTRGHQYDKSKRRCPECKRISSNEYYAANQDKVADINKKHCDANTLKIKARSANQNARKLGAEGTITETR